MMEKIGIRDLKDQKDLMYCCWPKGVRDFQRQLGFENSFWMTINKEINITDWRVKEIRFTKGNELGICCLLRFSIREWMP